MSKIGSGQHGIVDSVVARTAVQRIRQQVMISTTNIGRSAPLGATVTCGGVNFSVFSRNASGIDLLLFDHVDDGRASHVIRLDPTTNRTYHYWHVFVPGLQAGQLYGYRVHGPFDPAKGLRFDPTKVLLDPYGRGVAAPRNYSREAARQEGDNAATAMKSVVVDVSLYDWEGDTPLRRPSSQTIIYEMHVKGFTRHPSSGVPEATRGTFRGLTRRFHISRTWESQPSNFFPCSSSIRRTARPVVSTIGVMRPYLFLHRIRPTALGKIPWAW